MMTTSTMSRKSPWSTTPAHGMACHWIAAKFISVSNPLQRSPHQRSQAFTSMRRRKLTLPASCMTDAGVHNQLTEYHAQGIVCRKGSESVPPVSLEMASAAALASLMGCWKYRSTM